MRGFWKQKCSKSISHNYYCLPVLFLFFIYITSCNILSVRWEAKNYISFTYGEVKIERDKLEIKGKVGDIKPPYTVKTEDNSLALISIHFPPNETCKIKLYPKSSVSIINSSKTPEKMTSVKLNPNYGIVIVESSNCIIEISDSKVRWANAQVRIRKNQDKKLMKLEILKGEVILEGKRIDEGNGIEIGEKGFKTYSLPESPSIVYPIDEKFIKPLKFLWVTTYKSAKSFIEISSDENFEILLFVGETNSTKFFPNELTLNLIGEKYYWRVWSIDQEDRGSTNSNIGKFSYKD